MFSWALFDARINSYKLTHQFFRSFACLALFSFLVSDDDDNIILIIVLSVLAVVVVAIVVVGVIIVKYRRR